jgi:repressor LexA
MALTRRQKEVLDFVAEFIKERGYSPSYDEIGTGMKLASLATVHKHILALESKNYLKRGFNQSRSLELGDRYFRDSTQFEQKMPPPLFSTVPLLGRIAAGVPVEAIPNHAELAFSDFVQDDSTFALQVRGESMIEDHICDGDFVLIERTDRVRDGDTVVALVDGMEATLKRFYREPDGRIRLQPANRTMEPIYLRPDQLHVQGKLLAVMRKFRN